jgi:hypothetical protein
MMAVGETDDRKQFPSWIGIPLLVLFLPIVLLFLIAYLLFGLFLHVAVWVAWLPRGKSILIVTSDSPIWTQYMADRIVGVLQQKAIVLNWSQRSQWPSFPSVQVMLFHYFGRGQEFNPLVVVFRPLRLARVFRFWKPFKHYKHGSPDALEHLTEEALQYSLG